MKYDEMLSSIDDRAGLDRIGAALAERLGYKVRVDKVANRLILLRMEEHGVTIGEAIEQELLASADPLELLVREVTHEVPLPSCVYVDRKDMTRLGPSLSFAEQKGVVEVSEGLRSLCLPTEEGPVPLYTISSRKGQDLRSVKNELARLMTKLAVSGTLVVLGEVRSWRDEVSGSSQVWFDGAVLPGRWNWDAGRGQMVRT